MVVAEYNYDAFGNPVLTGAEGTVINPYRYAGYRYDSETSFYYLNARYYWANVGRFITRDTFLGITNKPESLNLYGYGYGNPVENIDPSGNVAVHIPWGGGKYVNATFDKIAMHLINNQTVRQIVMVGGWNGAYRIANELKWTYYKIFKKGFNVSTKSVAIEIIGHVVPDLLATIIGVNSHRYPLLKSYINKATYKIKSHTRIIDIGVWGHDWNRGIWDYLTYKAWWLKSTY